MNHRGPLGRAARAGLIVLVAGLGLAACATTGPASPGPPLAREGHDERGGRGEGGRLHGTEAPYQVDGRWYYPHAQPNYDEVGVASWYGAKFHNHRTADGEIFDQNAPSAAHKTLPLPSIVEVTNLENGRRVRVRLNDRGPFVGGRLLDLSRAAATELGFEREGVARVRVRYVGPAPPLAASGVMIAAAPRPRPAPVAPPPAQEPPEVQAPPPVEAARDDAPPPTAGYAVQAGAFQSREIAERAAAQLTQTGAASIQPVRRNGGVFYRVVVSGFADEDSAAGALVQVLDAGFSGARVVGAE
jgi:rare lipoprotein A